MASNERPEGEAQAAGQQGVAAGPGEPEGQPRSGGAGGRGTRGGLVAGLAVGAAVLAITVGLVMGLSGGEGGVTKKGEESAPAANTAAAPDSNGSDGNDSADGADATPPADEEQQAKLDKLAADIAEKNNVQVGVAILGQEGPLHAGKLNEEGAWSTIKVPIAGAVEEKLRHAEAHGQPAPRAAMEADMDAAIHHSDNDAAFRLWMYVGDGSDRTASYKVRDYMHRVGDPTNAAKQFEDGVYFGFGAIKWKLTDQVKFMNGFRCMNGSDKVLERMGHIIPEHSYGLAKIKGAQFKGGWGPEPDGRFIYRQLGLVPGPDGEMTPVAIMVIPNDGFEPTAWEGVDALAKGLPDVLEGAPPAKTKDDC
ncbi:hypothetical protein [uncultured Corynebacterium sp.]|uniref:hypothetical protein n=1 Tax=uncultured Corynebacterium sp. TaxID=159447 RepID=UPI00260B95CB|nr:hypothetical protein [uncultured Corynebacterium sp.]